MPRKGPSRAYNLAVVWCTCSWINYPLIRITSSSRAIWGPSDLFAYKAECDLCHWSGLIFALKIPCLLKKEWSCRSGVSVKQLGGSDQQHGSTIGALQPIKGSRRLQGIFVLWKGYLKKEGIIFKACDCWAFDFLGCCMSATQLHNVFFWSFSSRVLHTTLLHSSDCR